jgi:hypothetical protein
VNVRGRDRQPALIASSTTLKPTITSLVPSAALPVAAFVGQRIAELCDCGRIASIEQPTLSNTEVKVIFVSHGRAPRLVHRHGHALLRPDDKPKKD